MKRNNILRYKDFTDITVTVFEQISSKIVGLSLWRSRSLRGCDVEKEFSKSKRQPGLSIGSNPNYRQLAANRVSEITGGFEVSVPLKGSLLPLHSGQDVFFLCSYFPVGCVSFLASKGVGLSERARRLQGQRHFQSCLS